MDVEEMMTADPRELRTAEPFSVLFTIDPKIQRDVTRSMKARGFDQSKPIEVWRQQNVVIDGHTRRLAAVAAGLRDVPICLLDFETEDEALRYAIANQRDRRNITGAEIVRCVLAVDKRKTHGGDPGGRGNQYKSGKTSMEVFPPDRSSAAATAAIVGVSRATVERVRTASEDPEQIQEVLEGRKTIRMAAREVAAAKDQERAANPKPHPKPKGKKRGRKIPDPVVPRPAEPVANGKSASSVVRLSAADEAWLATFPIRSRVVAHRFDEDALLYRLAAARLQAIRDEIRAVVGQRSPVGKSLYYRQLSHVVDAAPIAQWQVCHKCEGNGVGRNGPCAACHGGGYLIPNLLKRT